MITLRNFNLCFKIFLNEINLLYFSILFLENHHKYFEMKQLKNVKVSINTKLFHHEVKR